MRIVALLFVLTYASLFTPSNANSQERKRPAEHIIFEKNDTERCLKCHSMKNFAFRHTVPYGEHLHDFSVDADSFKTSVHGKIACQECHTDITEYPHPFEEERARVSCGTDCHATDSTGKKYSHATVFAEFQSSVHKKSLTQKDSDSPTCITCHGSGNPHAILKARQAIGIQEKMALCVTCHENTGLMAKNDVDINAVSSYKRSFHYKAIRFGETNTAVCQDCHTVHNILPKDSVRSSISTANIAQTCGQEDCHPGAKMNFAMSGANHLTLRIEREPVLFYLEKFFVVLTLGTMAMLFVGIVLDVQKKFGWLEVFGLWLGWMGKRMRDLAQSARAAWKFSKRILID